MCHASCQERAGADSCRESGDLSAGAQDVGGSPIDAFAWGSIVLGNQLDISSEFDRRLSIGASIACRLRGAIRQQLGECFLDLPFTPFHYRPAPPSFVRIIMKLFSKEPTLDWFQGSMM